MPEYERGPTVTSAWDVFHSERLEVERGVAAAAVRDRLAAGTLHADDLIRPAGTTRWSRIGQVAVFAAPDGASVEASVEALPVAGPAAVEADPHAASTVEFEPVAADFAPDPERDSGFEPATLPDDEAGDVHPDELLDPLPPEFEAEHDAEDDPAADFTLTRNRAETVEELDLAAMVDVAFQLVLFFLVTASTVVFKTLEVPRPNEDRPPEAAAQARAKSVDELEKDYILVEVDAEGALRVDHLPIPADRAALTEKLRAARESTGRKAMLLSADPATKHRNAVLALDVAGEIDLQVAIAQPAAQP